ncbi:DUF2971 domain-containing protein [Aeromonas veronii]
MNILYKYYSDLPLSYFDEPTLKLAQPKGLNDPFESKIQNGIIMSDSVIRKKLKQRKAFANDDKTNRTIIRNIFNLLNASGVISLSETQRNILMWAHYANEHKGLCIGYKQNPLEISASQRRSNHEIYYKLHKVNYDTSRYDPINDELDNESVIRWVNSVAKKVLTTKSDEWIYEKEHRYIHPISDCDYILSKGNMTHNAFSRSIYNSHRLTKIVDKWGETVKYSVKKKDIITEAYIFELQKRNNLTFLKKIPPQKISSIYLGCRYPLEKEINLMLKLMSGDCCFSHVRVFRMQLCPMEFRLLPIQIYPPKS